MKKLFLLAAILVSGVTCFAQSDTTLVIEFKKKAQWDTFKIKYGAEYAQLLKIRIQPQQIVAAFLYNNEVYLQTKYSVLL